MDISHFKIIKNVENDTAAMVNPIIVGRISKVYNYPPAVLFTSDYIGRSWIDTTSFNSSEEGREALKVLFEHEKLHLDIMEIYTRKAQDSLDRMIFHSYTEKYSVIDYFLEVSDSIQEVFDGDTNHGTIEEKNREWTNYISKLLKKSGDILPTSKSSE